MRTDRARTRETSESLVSNAQLDQREDFTAALHRLRLLTFGMAAKERAPTVRRVCRAGVSVAACVSGVGRAMALPTSRRAVAARRDIVGCLL